MHSRWPHPATHRSRRIAAILQRAQGRHECGRATAGAAVLVQRFMQSVGSYNRRHFLKVGITGWAQVNGWRGDTSIDKRIEYDLYYVRHWTLSFDLLIVLLTLVRGFTDKNAY